jgi:hypothetical protein
MLILYRFDIRWLQWLRYIHQHAVVRKRQSYSIVLSVLHPDFHTSVYRYTDYHCNILQCILS